MLNCTIGMDLGFDLLEIGEERCKGHGRRNVLNLLFL